MTDALGLPAAESDPLAAITASTSCEQAFTLILRHCCDEIDRHIAVFYETEDESGPHKARVALRRLTTALDAFAPILRRKKVAPLRAEAKRIFRALGEVRDADVFLDAHRGETKTLERETLALREKTRKALRTSGAVAFAPALLRQLAEGAIFKRSTAGIAMRGAPVAELAGQALDQIWQNALSHGHDLADLKEADRHEFRKDMKTLRYLAEFFAPLWPQKIWRDFRENMQDLQDQLGFLNDLANAAGRGRTAPEDKVRAALKGAEDLWAGLRAKGRFWAHLTPDA